MTVRADSLRLLMVCAGLLALPAVAGCASAQIDRGIQLYREQKHDMAVAVLEKALRTEEERSWYEPKLWFRRPGNVGEGRVALKLARVRSAESHAARGHEFYRAGNLQQAQEELRIAAEYDPTHTLAANLLSHTTWQNELADTAIGQAQVLIDAGSWDEAIEVLDGIMYLAPTRPAIREMQERSTEASFQQHFDNGKQCFETAAYSRGVDEFRLALSRKPDSSEASAWYARCLDHRRAAEKCEQASDLLNGGSFAEAYDRYGSALELVEAFGPAIAGRKQARDRWVEQLLASARELLETGGKKECFRAYDQLMNCEELHAGHVEVDALRPLVSRRLAEMLAAEASALLAESGTQRAATAWIAAKRAEEFDPTVPGAAELAAATKELMDAVATRFVTVHAAAAVEDGAGDGASFFARRLAAGVAGRLNQSGVPLLSVSSGDRNAELLRMKGDISDAYAGRAIAWNEMALHLIVSKRSAERTPLQHRTTIPSRRRAGWASVANEEWERRSAEFQEGIAKLAELQSAHRQAKAACEAARVEQAKADVMYEAAQKRYGLVLELRAAHERRGKSYMGARLPRGANVELENYRRLEGELRLANSQRDRQADARATAHNNYRLALEELNELERTLHDTQNRLAGHLQYLESQEPQQMEPKWEAYELAAGYVTCSGQVQIDSELRSNDAVLAKPAAAASNAREVRIVSGADVGDTGGFINQPSTLPSLEAFLADLERQATADCLQQLLRFFSEQHQQYFDKARDAHSSGRADEALEMYIRYMYLDGGNTPLRYRAAEAFVGEKIVEPLTGGNREDN